MGPDPISANALDPGESDLSERRSSGWDIRNAPRNYIWLLIFQAGSALFSFAAFWLITHYIGAEGYGALMAVIVASQVALIFIHWTCVAVVRYGVDEFVQTAKVARTFWTRTIILAVNLAAVLASGPLWFPPLAEWLRMSPESLSLVLLHCGVTAIWTHVQVGLQAAKMLRSQGMLQMIERLLILAGIAGLVAANAIGFRNAVLCYILAPAVISAAGVFSLRAVIFSRFEFRWEDFRKLLAYSLPLLPFAMVGYFSGSYLDAFFISKFLSTRDLGIYALAMQINGIAMQVPTLANTVLLPLFVTQQAEASERSFNYFRTTLPSLVLLGGFTYAALAFACSLLIPVVFKPEFAEAVTPVWILLSATAVWLPVAIGYAALANSSSATYIPMICAIASSSLNVAANFILIPRYGMMGCAMATLIAFTASVATLAVLLNRFRKMPLSWTFVACIPSVAGAGIIFLTESATFAFMASITISLSLGVRHRNELVSTVTTFAGLLFKSLRT